MRKTSLLLLMFVLVVALMPLASAAASTQVEVSGTMSYTPFLVDPLTPPKIAGGNTFLETYEHSYWTGSFVGYSYDECSIIIHRNGSWNYNSIGYFDGFVNGVEGKLTLRFNGSRPDALSDWTGRWTILKGSGGLANLHGTGTFSGPGAPALGEEGAITYDGKVHFALAK